MLGSTAAPNPETTSSRAQLHPPTHTSLPVGGLQILQQIRHDTPSTTRWWTATNNTGRRSAPRSNNTARNNGPRAKSKLAWTSPVTSSITASHALDVQPRQIAAPQHVHRPDRRDVLPPPPPTALKPHPQRHRDARPPQSNAARSDCSSSLSQLHLHRLVEMLRTLPPGSRKPALDRGQRHRTTHRTLLGRPRRRPQSHSPPTTATV